MMEYCFDEHQSHRLSLPPSPSSSLSSLFPLLLSSSPPPSSLSSLLPLLPPPSSSPSPSPSPPSSPLSHPSPAQILLSVPLVTAFCDLIYTIIRKNDQILVAEFEYLSPAVLVLTMVMCMYVSTSPHPLYKVPYLRLSTMHPYLTLSPLPLTPCTHISHCPPSHFTLCTHPTLSPPPTTPFPLHHPLLISPLSPLHLLQLVAALLLHHERKLGVRSSAILFIFWMCMVIYGSFKLRTLVLMSEDDVSCGVCGWRGTFV